MKTERLSYSQLGRAAELLLGGNLVAFPTETVYGLGACISNEEAIRSIFEVKGRPSDNPLIVHVGTLEQVEELAIEIPPIFYTLASHFFPGPLTVILGRHNKVPAIVSAGLQTVAVRIPFHPIARELILLTGGALVAPSANLSGKPSSTEVGHVLEDFDGKISAVVDGGKTEWGVESTVVSLLEGKVVLLRPGAISLEEIEAVIGGSVEVAQEKDCGLSPGMRYRHYAPCAPMKLFFSKEELVLYWKEKELQGKGMVLSQSVIPIEESHELSVKNFYSQLRLADRKGLEEILVLCDEEVRKDLTLMNRIMRASRSE